MRVISQSGDKLIALLLSPGEGPAMFADAKLIAFDKLGATARDLGLSNYRGQLIGGGGDWVFIAGAPASRLLNVRTGQVRDLPVNGGVFGAVAAGETLALLRNVVSSLYL